MARKFRLGPCRLLSSASITDPLATWHDHGWIRGNVIDRYADNYVNTGRADQNGRTPRADAVYVSGSPQAGYTIPLLNYQIDEILRVFPGAVKVTNSTKHAIGISTPASTLTPRAFALVPEADFNEALPGSWWSSDHVRYIEEGILHITESFTYNLPDGDDILESKAYVCEVMALADADAAQTGGIGLYRVLKYLELSVGSNPTGVAISPDGTKAVITNNTANNVTIINLADNTKTTVSVGLRPFSVAITPDNLKAIVTNNSAGTVTIITFSDSSTETVTVQSGPRGVAITPDGTKAIVANEGSNSASIITLSDNSVVNVAVGTNPNGVAVRPDNSEAIVANPNSANITRIVLSDNSTTNVSVAGGPIAVAVTPDNTKVLVVRTVADAVSVVTLSDNTATTFNVGDGPLGVAISPNGNVAAITNSTADTITIHNLSNGTSKAYNAEDTPYFLAFTPDGLKLIVSNNGESSVTMYTSIF